MKLTHKFAEMTPEKGPQDPDMNGTCLRSETKEHGGEYSDTMPQAIKLIDAEGRSCIYVSITQDGRLVDSHGFALDAEDDCAPRRCGLRREHHRHRLHQTNAHTGRCRAPVYHVSRFDARNDFLQVTNDPLHVGAERK
jgi:hypothetical protein